jgi:hypothetical protein
MYTHVGFKTSYFCLFNSLILADLYCGHMINESVFHNDKVRKQYCMYSSRFIFLSLMVIYKLMINVSVLLYILKRKRFKVSAGLWIKVKVDYGLRCRVFYELQHAEMTFDLCFGHTWFFLLCVRKSIKNLKLTVKVIVSVCSYPFPSPTNI